jgi:GT2 family glycosyltransferase
MALAHIAVPVTALAGADQVPPPPHVQEADVSTPVVPSPPDRGSAEPPPGAVIGLCTYNRGRKILQTLEALDRQDLLGGRISGLVVVDNRSTDDTASVVDEFARGSVIPTRRIHEPEPGKSAAMRRLFRDTTEPIIVMIDDDCLPDPAWAASLVRRFDHSPACGAVGGRVRIVWVDGSTKLALKYQRTLGEQNLGDQAKLLDDPASFLMGASLAVRRDAVLRSGWMEDATLDCRRGPLLECGEDAELELLIRRAGFEVWYEPASTMGHLIPASRTTSRYLARLRESITRTEATIKFLAHPDPSLAWACSEAARAQRLYLKSLLFDWRPTRRRIRVAERRGKRDGWNALVAKLRTGGATVSRP